MNSKSNNGKKQTASSQKGMPRRGKECPEGAYHHPDNVRTRKEMEKENVSNRRHSADTPVVSAAPINKQKKKKSLGCRSGELSETLSSISTIQNGTVWDSSEDEKEQEDMDPEVFGEDFKPTPRETFANPRNDSLLIAAHAVLPTSTDKEGNPLSISDALRMGKRIVLGTTDNLSLLNIDATCKAIFNKENPFPGYLKKAVIYNKLTFHVYVVDSAGHQSLHEVSEHFRIIMKMGFFIHANDFGSPKLINTVKMALTSPQFFSENQQAPFLSSWIVNIFLEDQSNNFQIETYNKLKSAWKHIPDNVKTFPKLVEELRYEAPERAERLIKDCKERIENMNQPAYYLRERQFNRIEHINNRSSSTTMQERLDSMTYSCLCSLGCIHGNV